MVYFPLRYYTNLGNWLFQYATAISYAAVSGDDVAVWLEDRAKCCQLAEYAELFPGLTITERFPTDARVYNQPGFEYKPLPLKGEIDKNVILYGFFQSDKFFDKDLVRQRLAISETRKRYLEAKYGESLHVPNVTGISVRHGKDYLSGCDMHPFVGKKYFSDAIKAIPETSSFVVCSDDIPWCREFFPRIFPKKKFVFAEGESVIDQLYLQSLCANNIISNSSFSWWGAWLNGNPSKKVFAPSMWFGPMAKYSGMDWKDIYPEKTIIIQNKPTLWEWVNMQTRLYYNLSRRLYARVKDKLKVK